MERENGRGTVFGHRAVEDLSNTYIILGCEPILRRFSTFSKSSIRSKRSCYNILSTMVTGTMKERLQVLQKWIV